MPTTTDTSPSRAALAPAHTPRRTYPAGHLAAVDGCRGLAVIATMLFHVQFFAVVTGGAWWEPGYARLAGLGWAGVDLFFVISGFLITGILYDSRRQSGYFRVFYLRRTVRIVPLYYGALLAFFVLLPLALRLAHVAPSPGVFGTTGTQLLAWGYLVNWAVGMHGYRFISPFITHFWSLSIEEQFYLAWPAVVRALSRRRLLTLAAGVVLASSLARLALFVSGWPTAAYFLTVTRLDGLAIGACVALAARDADDWATLVRWCVPLTAAAFGALAGLVAQTGTTSFGDAAVGTVGISLLSFGFGAGLVVAISHARAARVLSGPVLRWFGKYSYGLYLVNQPVVLLLVKAGVTAVAIERLVGSKALGVLAVNAAAFGVCAAAAFASWHVYEKHWLALKERRGFRHAAPASDVATAAA